jgi:hypothetical protein
MQKFNRFGIGFLAPPVGGESPQAESDFAHGQIGFGKSTKFHFGM